MRFALSLLFLLGLLGGAHSGDDPTKVILNLGVERGDFFSDFDTAHPTLGRLDFECGRALIVRQCEADGRSGVELSASESPSHVDEIEAFQEGWPGYLSEVSVRADMTGSDQASRAFAQYCTAFFEALNPNWGAKAAEDAAALGLRTALADMIAKNDPFELGEWVYEQSPAIFVVTTSFADLGSGRVRSYAECKVTSQHLTTDGREIPN